MKMRGGSFSFYEDDTNMAQVILPIPIMPQEKKKLTIEKVTLENYL